MEKHNSYATLQDRANALPVNHVLRAILLRMAEINNENTSPTGADYNDLFDAILDETDAYLASRRSVPLSVFDRLTRALEMAADGYADRAEYMVQNVAPGKYTDDDRDRFNTEYLAFRPDDILRDVAQAYLALDLLHQLAAPHHTADRTIMGPPQHTPGGTAVEIARAVLAESGFPITETPK